MVDEVYNRMDDQIWEIPPSNRYVSDSESPLSLLSSPTTTMPSPTLHPVNNPYTQNATAMIMSSITPYHHQAPEYQQLSYASSSLNDRFYPNKKQAMDNSKKSTSDEEVEEAITNASSVMYHEHIIACNDTISCIRPQSVSIQWLRSADNLDDTTTTNANNEEELLSDNEEECYQSSINSSATNTTDQESSQEDESTTANSSSDSHSIRIIITNRGQEIVNQVSRGGASQITREGRSYMSTQEKGSSNDNTQEEVFEQVAGKEHASSSISHLDIAKGTANYNNNCAEECQESYNSSVEDEDEDDGVDEGEPYLTEETDTSKESDYLRTPTPPPVPIKKRKYSKCQKSIESEPSASKKKRKVMPTMKKVGSSTSSNPSSNSSSPSSHKEVRKEVNSSVIADKKKKKRTVTSYDAQTSQYLKSVFFEVYSKQSKLTKEQRAKVQEKTGLPSRNITYWFSNHKRRFKDTLKVYRKAVADSEGGIKTYDDFIQWRKDRGLSIHVTQEEVASE